MASKHVANLLPNKPENPWEELGYSKKTSLKKPKLSIDDQVMIELWDWLEARFGKAFTNQYGTRVKTWQTELSLAGITPEMLKKGLRKVVLSGKEYPPTLPQFVAYCRSDKSAPYHKPFPLGLPKPRTPKTEALKKLAVIKEKFGWI